MSDSDSHTDTTAAFMASLMSNDQTITDHGEGDSLLTLHNEKKEEEKSPETSPSGIKGVLKHKKSRRKKRTRKANPTEQVRTVSRVPVYVHLRVSLKFHLLTIHLHLHHSFHLVCLSSRLKLHLSPYLTLLLHLRNYLSLLWR